MIDFLYFTLCFVLPNTIWQLVNKDKIKGKQNGIRHINQSAEMKKDLIIECVPEQEKTKHLALSNGFTHTGNFDNLNVFRLKAQR